MQNTRPLGEKGHCGTGTLQGTLGYTLVDVMLTRSPSLLYVLLLFIVRTYVHRGDTKAPMYYRNANCAVVVYDITQSTSLEKAKSWIRELQRQADPNIVIALCGNKLDLAARRQVSEEEAKKYAEEEGLMWGETSAKTGEGVSDIFTSIGAQSRHSYWFVRLTQLYSQEAPSHCSTISERWRSCRPSENRGRPQQASSCWSGPGRAVQLLDTSPPAPAVHASHRHGSRTPTSSIGRLVTASFTL